jgi:2-polyprenyl-6-methoxyphenol hydroxylase-like FAD-dependent oxidoreductase
MPPASHQRRRVAVVGAGPSGLVAARSLKGEGLEPVVLEQSDARPATSLVEAAHRRGCGGIIPYWGIGISGGGSMTVKRTVYTSPVEALAALIRSLVAYEQRYQMSSADFYSRYQRGEIGDSIDFVEWAGDYQHYQEIKEELERKLAAAG